jgi:two-component system, cell cycle response regulator DivK
MSRHILVVEDQEDNRQILRDLLGNAGYELTEAENGEEAIAAVAQRRPDLILMDIQLPVMDGYEATRRIRTNPDLKSVPIIAVTSYALADDESKALQFASEGAEIVRISPAEFGAFLEKEMTKWGRVVKEGGIKAE